jgi:phenylacetate-coenzyme A ligase PaaK-like adenylate-forming protein
MLPLLPEALVRNVIYPVYRGFRGDRVLDILDELEHNQFLPPGDLEGLKWSKLEALLQNASRFVPYYGELFESRGIDVASLSGPADMARIPFLTVDIVRREGDRMMSRDPMRRGYPCGAGGSSGEGTIFRCDSASAPVRRAAAMRGYRWTGFDIGGRQALLWGSVEGGDEELLQQYPRHVDIRHVTGFHEKVRGEYTALPSLAGHGIPFRSRLPLGVLPR